MKLLVGYNGSAASRRALDLAMAQAKAVPDAFVYVVTSMEGGAGEKLVEIQDAEEKLQWAKEFLSAEKIACDAVQLARGLNPGEDIVLFAEENDVDHIFLGVEKRSRTSKLLLGSTAQYVILRGPCPVTTTK